MKFSIAEKLTDADHSKKWRVANPEKHNASSHTAREAIRAGSGFTCIDGENQHTHCELEKCLCSLYDGVKVCEEFQGSRGKCSECGHTKHDHKVPPCAVCGHGKYDHAFPYVLLGCGTGEPLENMNGIGWEEAFTYLYKRYTEKPFEAYAGFFLGYDFAMILRTLPKNKAYQLYYPHGNRHDINPRLPDITSRYYPDKNTGQMCRYPNPVHLVGEHRKWDVDILDDRKLKIKPWTCECPDDFHIGKCRTKSSPWMTICDTGSFFQTSFLNVISPDNWVQDKCSECVKAVPCTDHQKTSYKCAHCVKASPCHEHRVVSDEEYADIEAGKGKRDTARLDDEMRHYNSLENEILARVMVKYREGLKEAGVKLRNSQWIGPGQPAGKFIEKCGKAGSQDGVNSLASDTIKNSVKPVILQAANASYIGGWFEVTCHGHVPGITWEYDINSAYPFIIKDLPCLIHGKYQMSALKRDTLWKMPQNSAFRLIHTTVKGSNPYLGAMLHRDGDRNISRPHITHGWFFQHELEAAQRAGLIDSMDIGPCEHWLCAAQDWSAFTYLKDDCLCPMAEVGTLYELRKEKEKNSPMGKAIKLLLNSIYGKFAQLAGEPQWANDIYASLITSGTRTMILDAIATHPGKASAVVMVATDGVYFTEKHPTIDINKKELGKWEEVQHENITLFKPGFYWDDEARENVRRGEAPKFKARGINAREVAGKLDSIDRKFSAWNGNYPVTEDQWPSVDIPVNFSVTSPRQALAWGKWEEAGKVQETRMTHKSYPGRKRHSGKGSIVMPDQHWDKNGVRLIEGPDTIEINGELIKAANREAGYYDGRLYRSIPHEVATIHGYDANIVCHPRTRDMTSATMRENSEFLDSGLTDDGQADWQIIAAVGMRD